MDATICNDKQTDEDAIGHSDKQKGVDAVIYNDESQHATDALIYSNKQELQKTWTARCLEVLRRNLLVFLTVVGVGIGLAIGLAIAPTKPSASVLLWVGMAGELYIRMLKSMIVPLIISSVIAGTASMDPRSNGRISAVCLGYIMITNCIPAIVGTVACLIIKPGEGLGSDISIDKTDRDIMETEDIFADLLRNIFPDNLIASCFQQAQTKYEYEDIASNKNITESIRTVTRKYVGAANSSNILGLIIASTLFGIGTSAMKEKGHPFLHFFQSATDIIIRILRVLIWATPVGVASLMAKTIAATHDLDDVFRKLGIYSLTVMGGLLVWMFLVLPLVFFIARRKNPYRFILSIIHPIMIVFATGSTVIALPDSYHSLEDKNNVDKRVSRFVAPISATIGRAGSSLYISASCMFIIQLIDMEVNAANIILVIVLTSVSTLAIPSVTGASLITVLILLTALNIPGEAATILFTLEFFMDRSRSVVNLTTQLTGVIVTERLCKSAILSSTDAEEKKETLDTDVELQVHL